MRSTLILLAAVFLTQCGDDDPLFSFANEGVVRGHVYVFGSADDHAGSTVTLQAAHYKKTVTTDEEGFYQFDNVPTSNCEITYLREGYGMIRFFNIRQSGRDTLNINNPYSSNAVTFYAIPDYAAPEISHVSASIFNRNLSLDITTSATENGTARGFISTSPDVSDSNYINTWYFNYGEGLLTITQFISSDFARRYPGVDKLYVRLYSDGGGRYFDYRQDRWIFSALNHRTSSNIMVFNVP